jgi:hypothetical protein
MPASKVLQQKAIAVKRLTGSNDVKASRKSIYSAMRRYSDRSENNINFGDDDQAIYEHLSQGDEFDNGDGIEVWYNAFKLDDRSIVVVQTYDGGVSGEGDLYIMQPDHNDIYDLRDDIVESGWYNGLH